MAQTYAVERALLDTTKGMQIETRLGARDIYADNETLTGVSVLPPEVPTIPEDDVIDQPVIIEMPSVPIPRDTNSTNNRHHIYVGLLNTTRSVPFVPSTLYRFNDDGTYGELGTPTRAIERGKLVGLPLPRRNPFTTDDESVLIVRFDFGVPTALLQNLTSMEPLYASYETNMLAVGKEYIQFQTYTVQPDGRTVEFRNLLRGRHGTEQSARPPTAVNEGETHVLNEDVYVYDAQAWIRITIPPTASVGDRLQIVARRSTTTPINYQRTTKLLTFNAHKLWAPYTIVRSDFVGGFPLGASQALTMYVRGRLRYDSTFADDPPPASDASIDYLSLFVLYAPFNRAQLQSEIFTKRYNGAPPVTGVDTRPLSTYIIWHRVLSDSHRFAVGNSSGNNQFPPGFILWNANPALRRPMWAVAWSGPRDEMNLARVTECYFDPKEDYRVDPFFSPYYSDLNLEDNETTRRHHNYQGFERGTF